MMKPRILVTLLGSLLVIGSAAVAQAPKTNVSGARHPNLAAAQRLSLNAYDKIIAAQKATEWDMAGHAQKAKDLLDPSEQRIETRGARSE